MNKISETASKMMSWPWRKYGEYKGWKYDLAKKTLKEVRKNSDAPDFDEKGVPTPTFKTRTMADAVRRKYTNK